MTDKVCVVSKRHIRRLISKKLRNENTLPPPPPVEKYSLSEKLAQWCITHRISRNASDDLLEILISEKIQVPKCTKTLLGSKNYQIVVKDVLPGQYSHFGIEKSLKTLNLCLDSSTKKIYLGIGIDGLPLFKSSGKALWPILGSISENKLIPPFFIVTYVGENKKTDNINEFLFDFVEEIKYLKNNGIDLKKKHFDIDIRFFICDSSAKAFVTVGVGYTSANGCSN